MTDIYGASADYDPGTAKAAAAARAALCLPSVRNRRGKSR